MRLLKVILPPLIAFWSFAVLIRYSPSFHQVGMSSLGNDSVNGLISYYKIFAPFQLLIALLTQYLIILPLWDKILLRHRAAIGIFIGITLACFICAAGIAYIIWDKPTGVSHLINITMFMAAVQLFYWLINFLIMLLLDWKNIYRGDKEQNEE